MCNEKLIRQYYQAWISKDINLMKSVFSENCSYYECFGEEYHGEDQILQWFRDWNRKGTITEWSIKQTFLSGDYTIVESFFKCIVDKEFSCDAISVIHFNENGLIDEVREYWSRNEHHCPYEEKNKG